MANAPTQYLSNGGFNVLATISVADLNTTAATTKTITIDSIPTDAMVFDVGYRLITSFDGGATSALTVQIGDDDDADGFVAATSVHADNTPISSAANSGAYFTVGGDANTAKAKNYDNAAAKSLNVLFTATGANLTALTTGKLVVFAKVADLTAID